MAKTNCALISPLHDPEGNLVELVKSLGGSLSEIYPFVALGTTLNTSHLLLKELKKFGFNIIQGNYQYGEGKKEALTAALNHNLPYFHCADFCRSLYFIKYHYEELLNLLCEKNFVEDYIILGRTQKAFSSHPTSWVMTEKIINHLASEVLGLTVDISAGACLFNQKAARLILKKSQEKDFAVTSEWPILVKQAGLKLGHRTVNGYEWNDKETSSFATQKETHEEILKRYNSPTEWKKRVGRILECCRPILKNV